MKAADFARACAASSPLLDPLEEFNATLRRFVAAEAWLAASTEPAAGDRFDNQKGWAGYRDAQEIRGRGVEGARTALEFATRRAETALGRTLTQEEATRGFVFSCIHGFAGAPQRPEYLKPGRTIEEPKPRKRTTTPGGIQPFPVEPDEQENRLRQLDHLRGVVAGAAS